jgi:VIT1/CCC1 family predicted Fe2+/Mn2+ transporter
MALYRNHLLGSHLMLASLGTTHAGSRPALDAYGETELCPRPPFFFGLLLVGLSFFFGLLLGVLSFFF